MNTLSQQNEAHFHVYLDQRRLKVTFLLFGGRFGGSLFSQSLYSHGKGENVNVL